MTIADVIKKLRAEHNLTQEQLGDLLSCTKSYICRVEAGARIPGQKWVSRFAKEFGLDSDKLELLCGRVPEDKLKEVCKQLLREKRSE
jgi:transcriptional regulator with XRE-family HTH domain